MNEMILNSFSYGIYAIGVTDGTKMSACIANTVIQVANQPNVIALSMNHSNYSNECIRKKGWFTVSVLSEDTSGAIIGALGFSSGSETDKLKNIRYRVLAEGLPIIKENCCCWLLCKVVGTTETQTHTVFLAEVVAGSESIKGKPMTYDYYCKVLKGRAPKNAPAYREEQPDAMPAEGESWNCMICGYVYNDPYVPLEELPDNWVCPVCGAPKSVFKRQQ